MFFGYLGPMLIETGEAGGIPPSPRQRTVLAVLLTHAGRPVTVDELAEFVWDGKPPDRAADTLRTYVMRLRRSLGGTAGARIVTRDPGYLIEAAEEEVDALWFTRAYRDGAAAHQAGQWAAARAALAGGLALWRGDPLADVPSQLLRDAEAPALDRMRIQALQWRIDCDLQLGGSEELVAELQELTAREPLREQLHALLMTALARAGRMGEALDVFHRARDLLVSQLGIEPGPQLRELQRLILAGEQVRPPASAAVSPAARSVPHQLPATAGRFAGRAVELDALEAVLDQAGPGPRTATISAIGGMAGIGKTTLALHWAHQVADRFPDGQLYVNLRGFGPAAPLPPTDALRGFLDALRDPARPLPADPDAQEALYRSLMADRRVLVVLDNARDERQVRPLLPGSASCLTLITSRSQLTGLVATNGAIPVNLDLLTEAEALDLLSRRLGPERIAAERAAVEQLIATCSGLPLALCIVAARAASTPKLPLKNLSAQLSLPGLDALSGTDPYADLRSVFSWSYRRLSPGAARLFRCLPLFPGPDMSAAAAASIAPADRIGGLLTELTSAHLLEEYVPGRFRLHDLLARYAQECSGREDTEVARRDVLDRVLTWYAAAAVAVTRVVDPRRTTIPETDPPDPVPAALATKAQALDWLETERRNLVAAVKISALHGFDTVAITLPLTLWSFFSLRARWHDQLDTSLIGIAVARRTGNLHAEADLYSSISRAYSSLGRAEEGIDGLRRVLAIWQARGDLARQATSHWHLGIACHEAGLASEAISECEQAIELARESGDRRQEGRALSDLGCLLQLAARPEKALRCYLAAQAIATSLQDDFMAGTVQTNLAELYLELGRIEDSMAAATAGIEIGKQSGRRVDQANGHRILGDALNGTGRRENARTHWRAALAAYQELADARASEVAARLAEHDETCKAPADRELRHQP